MYERRQQFQRYREPLNLLGLGGESKNETASEEGVEEVAGIGVRATERREEEGEGRERLLLKFKSSSLEFTMPSSRRVAEIPRLLRRFLCLLSAICPMSLCSFSRVLDVFVLPTFKRTYG